MKSYIEKHIEKQIQESQAEVLSGEPSDMTVELDAGDCAVSETLLAEVKRYIDDRLVREALLTAESCRMEDCSDRSFAMPAAAVRESCRTRRLEDLLEQVGESFTEALLRMIDQRGLKDPEVYRRANMDRRHFSKIVNNRDYKPKKETVLALAIALRLNLDETKDLLARAEFALSRSSERDIIVEYFIENENYNIIELNQVLFRFTGQILVV